MRKNTILIFVLLSFLAILQVSFAPHFKIFSGSWFEWVNFVDMAVFGIALFERRRGNLGWLAAIWGGILLDLFSGRFFGFWIAALLGAVALIKMVLKKYVRVSSFW